MTVLGGNGLHSSKCNFILTVFGIEKFPYEDKRQKIFAAQTPQRKRGYVEDFTLKSVNALNSDFCALIILTSVTALLLRYIHVTYGKIAARQARGYGVLYEVPVLSAQVLFFI